MSRRFVPTAAGYDRWAAVYDTDGNPATALEERAFARWRRGRRLRGARVLDLGCGTGRHALALAAAGARVAGVDLSAGMLAAARAKDRAGQVDWRRVAPGRRLPFPSARFAAVVSGLVLEHVRDLRGFFAEARRVCAPGGELFVSAMHPAMLLRGSRAAFHDPDTGEKTYPRGFDHGIADFLNAAVAAGLALESMEELPVDAALARRLPRARKYLGYPLIVAFLFRRPR
ncbi:MAG: class I SAM-dependent methyltransferase [Elusimicrobiota bacterium]|nr:class I SAM-dependent methyltransferase [Elusimicrobiota bacterium]